MKISSVAGWCVAVIAIASTVAANAADYYWTGNGNDGKWSNVANWAMDAAGTVAATEVPVRGMKPSCHFDVPAEGLVVTQDYKTGNTSTTGVVLSNLVVTTSASAPVEFKIVSSEDAALLDFTAGASITVGAGITCTLNVSPFNGSTTQNLPKYGAGTLAVDYVFRSPNSPRPLVVYDGRAVVLSTSKDPRFVVRMAGTDSANPPVFENHLENGLYLHLRTTGLGGIKLNGKRLRVGDETDSFNATNTIPEVLDAGTLAYGNERVARIAEESPKYDIELDRADVLVPDNDTPVISLTFDDASNPKKDARGQGGRMTTIGTPSVVADAARGNVLSLDGNSGFKAQGAGDWPSGFDPKNGFTFAFWMKPDSSAVARAKILWWGAMANGKCAALRLHDGTQGGLFFNINSSGSDACYFPVSNLRDGAWHHVAVAFNAVQNKFFYYYDGALVKTAEFGGTYDPSKQALYVGNIDGSPWGSGNGYSGLLDDFLLAARPLSSDEVAAVKENGIGSFKDTATLKSLTANSSGVLSVATPGASLKTISGTALAGGVEMTKDGSRLTVGTDAGETATTFSGTIYGNGSTLVKAGAGYALTLSGATRGVTNVVVGEGSLTLSRPLASADMPAPVARWTFDGENPLAEASGNEALTLSQASSNNTFNVEFVAGDSICGKAAKFSTKTGNGFLRLDTFPTGVIPAGNSAFTVVLRYRPDTAQINDGALSAVGWGRAGGFSAGELFRIGPFSGNSESARFVIKNSSVSADGSYRTAYGNDRTRWYTLAVVHSSNSARLYVDGVFAKAVAPNYNILAQDFAIGASITGNKAFNGLVDDVQIFNSALSDEQVRTIADRLEASKGNAATDAGASAGVLRGAPDVTVAQGATFAVSSVESIGGLSGAGTVEVASQGRLNVVTTSGFSGSLAGEGALGFADGATLDIGDGSAPLVSVDFPFAVGTNVTVSTTARSGRYLIAHAASFADTANLSTWTATIVGGRKGKFFVASANGGGKDLYLAVDSGLIFVLR